MKNIFCFVVTIFVVSGLACEPSILFDAPKQLPTLGLDLPWQVEPQFTPVQPSRPSPSMPQGVSADCNTWCMYPPRTPLQTECDVPVPIAPAYAKPSAVSQPEPPQPRKDASMLPAPIGVQEALAHGGMQQSKPGSFGVRLVNFAHDQQVRFDRRRCVEMAYYAACKVQDFAAEFDKLSAENVYAHFDLYQFHDFQAYCRQCGDFDGYLVALHKKINSDYDFRRSTRQVEGFEYHHNLFSGHKSEFHKWVARQVKKIEHQTATEKQAAIAAEHAWVRACADVIKEEHEASRAKRTQWVATDGAPQADQNTETIEAVLADVASAQAYFQAALAAQGISHEERAMHELGMLCVQRACDAVADGTTGQALRHAQRARAIAQECAYNAQVQQAYELHEPVRVSLCNHDVLPEIFMHCQGNATLQVVHAELVSTINKTARVEYAYGNDLQIAGLTSLVYRMCDVTAACNQPDYPLERRFLLSDLCEHFYDMTRTTAHTLGTGVGCSRSAVHFGQTLLGAALLTAKDDLLRMATEVVSNPLPMAAGVAIGAVTPPAYLVAGLMLLGAANHQELCTWADRWLQDFKKNPDETVGKSIGSVISMLVVGSVTNVASKGTTAAVKALKKCAKGKTGARIQATLTKHLSGFKRLFIDEQKLAAIAQQLKQGGMVQGTVTPMQTVVKESVEITREVLANASPQQIEIWNRWPGKMINKTNHLVDDLLKSAYEKVQGNTTAVGRAFQKHSTRERTCFLGEISGHVAKNTQHGINYVDAILNNQNAAFIQGYKKRYGHILDVRIPGGMGARWASDGKKFIGFLEKD